MLSGILNQWLATLLGNVVILGYTVAIGWISPNLALLQSINTPLRSGPLSDEQISWVTSILYVGGLVGTVTIGRLADIIGRRKTVLLNTVPIIVSWAMIAIGRDFYLLMASRFLCGFGGGGIFVVLPIYVAEVAQDNKRGFFGSFIALHHGLGILIGYVTGAYLSYIGTPILIVALQCISFVAFLFFPETPQFLLTRRKNGEARESLEFFRKKSTKADINEEFDFLSTSIAKRMDYNEKLQWNDFNNKAAFKAIIISLAAYSICQLCGVPPVMNYASSFFDNAGSLVTSDISAVIMGSFQVLGYIISLNLVEKLGRKFLYVSSSLSTGLSLVVAGVYLYLKDHDVNVSGLEWIPLVSVCCAVIFAANGIVSLTYIITSETCSQKIRGPVMVLANFYGWLLNVLIMKYFFWMKDYLEWYGSLWLFSACCFLMVLFVVFCLPETKGKTIEAILQILEK